MEMIVTGWLVFEMTHSAFDVALIGFYRSIPLLLTGFIAGPLTNRVGRVRVVIVSQGIGVLVTAAIGILLWTDRLAFWHLAIGLDFLPKPSQLHGSQMSTQPTD